MSTHQTSHMNTRNSTQKTSQTSELSGSSGKKRKSDSPDKSQQSTQRNKKSKGKNSVESPIPAQQQKMNLDEQSQVLQEILKEVKSNGESLRSLTSQVKDLQESQRQTGKAVKKLEVDVMNLKTTVATLTVENNQLQQKFLSNDVLFSGLPPLKKNETPKFIDALATHLNVNINSDDIRDAFSIPSKDKKRSITIVKFFNHQKKSLVMECFRKKSPVVLEDLMSLPENDKRRGSQIYIGSNLTAENRNIMRAARAEQMFKFIWEREGRILIRPTEKANVIEVQSINQLNEIVQTLRYANPNNNQQKQPGASFQTINSSEEEQNF